MYRQDLQNGCVQTAPLLWLAMLRWLQTVTDVYALHYGASFLRIIRREPICEPLGGGDQ